jgi:hypothetical protein
MNRLQHSRSASVALILLAAATTAPIVTDADQTNEFAQPKPQTQTGFPSDLYSWVLPADNPETPAKISRQAALLR